MALAFDRTKRVLVPLLRTLAISYGLVVSISRDSSDKDVRTAYAFGLHEGLDASYIEEREVSVAISARTNSVGFPTVFRSSRKFPCVCSRYATSYLRCSCLH